MDEFRRLVIERWLVKAHRDRVASRTVLACDPPLTDVACFHAQQCAEKCLKAFLTFVDVHVEKTHDVVELVAVCIRADASFAALEAAADALTEYAITSRYPDDWREIPRSEADDAIRKAEEVYGFVLGRLPADVRRP